MTVKRFLYTSMIAGGLLTGCVSENPSDVNNNNNGNGTNHPDEVYRMTFNALEGNNQDTRASVDEGSLNNGQNKVRWDAGDQITVWTGDGDSQLTPCLFTTVDGGLTSAIFEYEGDKVDSYKYFGYYPYSAGLDYSNISINIPVNGIVQKVKNDSRHLGNYRPMYTSVVTRSESSSELTGMTFRHLTGLLYFRILNQSGKDAIIESVTVNCTKNVFSSHAVLNYSSLSHGAEPQFTVSGTNLSESVSLSLGNNGQGIAVSNEEIIQAFLPVLPVDNLAGTKLEFILTVDGSDRVSFEIDGDNVKSFEKAKYYRIGLKVTNDGIEVEPIIADWEQGDNIDIPV